MKKWAEYSKLNEDTVKKFVKDIKYSFPELDYSEFFRLYNVFNNLLPKDINKSLFDKNKYYAELISKNDNKVLVEEKFKDNIKVKEKVDKKWHPLIDFIYNKFKSGKKTEINKNFLKNVYFGEHQKSNDQSFHNFIKNPDYVETVKDTELKDYYKSFKWFDKNPNKIPTPVIIKLKNKYFLVGGNRRISWLLSKGLNKISVWLIQ